jgi:hypothetical protein
MSPIIDVAMRNHEVPYELLHDLSSSLDRKHHESMDL